VIGCYVTGFFGPARATFLALAFTFFIALRPCYRLRQRAPRNLASNAGSLAVFLINGKVLFPIAFHALPYPVSPEISSGPTSRFKP